ncbi:MAG: hypothetical protein ACC641_08180 [Acidiferrobacterales bacterium]
MRTKMVAIVLLTLVIAGCASSRPDWTDGGKSKKYPDSRYFTGFGTSTNLDAAKSRAKGNLTDKFLEKAEEAAKAEALALRRESKTVASLVNGPRVRGVIKRRSANIISGIKIADTWIGPKTNSYYAFAVLARGKVTGSLRDEINYLDRATGTYVKRSGKGNDILRRIRAASIALDAQIARGALDRMDKGSVPNPWQVAKLGADLDRLLKQVRITPQVIDDTTGTLLTSAQSALNGAEFRVSADDTSEFILDVRLAFEDLGIRDNWYWSRGVLKVTLRERTSGRDRGTVSWAIKASGRSNSDAEQRIAVKTDSLLKRQIRASIVKFATR